MTPEMQYIIDERNSRSAAYAHAAAAREAGYTGVKVQKSDDGWLIIADQDRVRTPDSLDAKLKLDEKQAADPAELAKLQKQLRNDRVGLTWRKKHGPAAMVPKWEQRVADLEARIAELES